MPGHSRSKNGVLSHAYVPGISLRRARPCLPKRDGRDKPGHDNMNGAKQPYSRSFCENSTMVLR
jgi:hypothetical protein